jgi:1-phosphatidylinositol-4-phosphate 5-kinase
LGKSTISRGGSAFFISADKRFMLKSVQPAERNVLKAHLGEYAAHMASNPNSFLTKYYGLYSVEVKS